MASDAARRSALHGKPRGGGVHRRVAASGVVTPHPSRCVQCGICSFGCPIGIDVRAHVWLGATIDDRRCLTCGECVARCPRGVLSFTSAGAAGGEGPA
ncbi:MAG: 4Fe-4S binding protein [Actinobacteria bacterium]|nr:4Fe-4S binding protein [Actinomycetota bacterium]